jgi:hypothetical protein
LGAAAAMRARIVRSPPTRGEANTRIAELTDATVSAVLTGGPVRERGIAGLGNCPVLAGSRELDQRAIVTETLKPPSKKLGVPHWPTRLPAGRFGPAMTHSRVSGGPTGSSRGRRSRSGSLPTPSWSGRSPTSVGSPSRRPKTRSCSASMKSRRSRPSTGRCRSCSCRSAGSNAGQMTTTVTTPGTLFAALDIAAGQVTAALKSRHQTRSSSRFSARSRGPTATSLTSPSSCTWVGPHSSSPTSAPG